MMRRILRVLLLTTTFGSLPQLLAGDLRITLPKGSNPTPVQALNQQGVNEVRKHHLEKAEKLFYRAYLIDPMIHSRSTTSATSPSWRETLSALNATTNWPPGRILKPRSTALAKTN